MFAKMEIDIKNFIPTANAKFLSTHQPFRTHEVTEEIEAVGKIVRRLEEQTA